MQATLVTTCISVAWESIINDFAILNDVTINDLFSF